MEKAGLEIFKKVMGGGIGAVLMVIGALAMILHKYVELDYPQYMGVGFGTMGIGCVIYLTMFVLQHREHMLDRNQKMALVASPPDMFDVNLERYEKVFGKHIPHDSKKN